jgi:hypothetical protein
MILEFRRHPTLRLLLNFSQTLRIYMLFNQTFELGISNSIVVLLYIFIQLVNGEHIGLLVHQKTSREVLAAAVS